MGGLRSRELLVVVIATCTLLLVRARGSSPSLPQASPLADLQGHLADGHGSFGGTSLVASRKQQLLRLSTVLVEQALFPKAKAVLAECVQLSFSQGFGFLEPEVQAQAELLRWRMGLRHLAPREMSDWLHPGGLLQKAVGDEEASPADRDTPPVSENAQSHVILEYLSFILPMTICAVVLFLTHLPKCSLSHKQPFLVMRSAAYMSPRALLAAVSTSTSTLKDALLHVHAALMPEKHSSKAASDEIALQFDVSCQETLSANILDEFESKAQDCFSESPSLAELQADSQPGSVECVDEQVLEALQGAQSGRDGILEASDHSFLETPKPPEVKRAPPGNTLHYTETVEFAPAEESADESEASFRVFSTDGSEGSCSETLEESPQEMPVVLLAKFPAADICFVDSVDVVNNSLAVQLRALSQEAFGEDASQLRKGEHVAVLLKGEARDEVICYANYVVRRDLQSLSVNKLAVAQSHRRRGLGRIMLRNLIQFAKRRTRGQLPLDVVCLSSLPTSICFYKSCGFYENPNIKLRREEAISSKGKSTSDFIEGQVYMEYRLQRKNSRRDRTW